MVEIKILITILAGIILSVLTILNKRWKPSYWWISLAYILGAMQVYILFNLDK